MSLGSRLRITRYHLRARVAGDLVLRDDPGSVFRGAFGTALRSLVCVTGASDCRGCPLTAECPYAFFMETPAPEGTLLAGAPAAPHPWVLEPPPGPARWRAGETLTLSFVLFGRAHDTLEICLRAFARAFAVGLGPRRIPLAITGIRADGDATWSPPGGFRPRPPAAPPVPPPPVRVIVEFETPLRLLREGRPLGPDSLGFADFLGALQRRLGLLEALHEGAASVWDYRTGLAEAASCPWDTDGLAVVRIGRCSGRRKRAVHRMGVRGRARLAVVPPALWPLLWRGQWTHVGKNAAFGLGRYRLLSPDDLPGVPGPPSVRRPSAVRSPFLFPPSGDRS